VVPEAKAAADATAGEVPAGVNCFAEPSIYGTVDPRCIIHTPTPAFEELIRAAIYGPVSEAGAEIASDALQATGNAALVQLATTSAFTPEQVALLEKMSNSDDPKTREAVEKIQNELSTAVAAGIETARKTVAPPLEKATGEVVNGVIVSFLNAVSDIPGVGFVLSALGLVDTAVKAVSSATDIATKVQEAAAPVTNAITEVQQTVGELTSAATAVGSVSAATPSVNEATPSVNEATPSVNEATPSVNEATQSVNEAPQSVNEAPQSVNEAPQSVNEAPQSVSEAPQSVNEEEEKQDNAGLGGGGSRKRRRIHKLSRRIERTLRRVQKKYGLGVKDKSDFLRRTLRRRKP
jgi:uncharacterized protein YoxC